MAKRAPKLTEHVVLRDVTGGDLPMVIEQQLDPGATYMAPFTRKVQRTGKRSRRTGTGF
ncbi:MAG TPA: hypothetical protein VJN63_00420 [Thermoplasmata archaeon]|nr:hypothetical protein [Thermoplasmata archaeon]